MNCDKEAVDNNFSSKERKKYQEIPINNPFLRDNFYWDRENETFDKIKVS